MNTNMKKAPAEEGAVSKELLGGVRISSVPSVGETTDNVNAARSTAELLGGAR